MRLAAYAFKKTVALAALGCLIGGGCGAVTVLDYATPNDTKTEQTLVVSVNRANKGDQLPSTSTIHSKSSSSTAMSPVSPKRPPLGCDRAFSSIADPVHAQIYKRCIA